LRAINGWFQPCSIRLLGDWRLGTATFASRLPFSKRIPGIRSTRHLGEAVLASRIEFVVDRQDVNSVESREGVDRGSLTIGAWGVLEPTIRRLRQWTIIVAA